MTVFTLLAGVLIAATLFASLLWGVERMFSVRGKDRISYACMTVLILAIMAALSLEHMLLARILSLPLVLAALVVAARAERWSRLLALPPLALGTILIAGLPFGPT